VSYYSSLSDEEREKVAFLLQVGRLSEAEFHSSYPLGRATLKKEGSIIRTADFWWVDPSGYDLFDSDEERISLLDKHSIK
jgi:hypothetical protein